MVDLTVNVLTASFWPTYPSLHVCLPPAVRLSPPTASTVQCAQFSVLHGRFSPSISCIAHFLMVLFGTVVRSPRLRSGSSSSTAQSTPTASCSGRSTSQLLSSTPPSPLYHHPSHSTPLTLNLADLSHQHVKLLFPWSLSFHARRVFHFSALDRPQSLRLMLIETGQEDIAAVVIPSVGAACV